jgi:protein O-mannosyl-transferase
LEHKKLKVFGLPRVKTSTLQKKIQFNLSPSVDWWICGLLFVVVLSAYYSVGGNQFISLDDFNYVTQNEQVRHGLTRQTLCWAFTSIEFGNWHPLTWISHALDCQWYGLAPAGHHLTSLVLHLANTVLLFCLLVNMTGRRWASASVALLFGLHPMHVESVAWVAERKDVLSGFFFLLSLLAYVRYAQPASPVESKPCRRKKFAAYVLSLILFTLGLMSKPMLVTLPLVLLLLDFWPLKRFPNSEFRIQNFSGLLVEKIPFFVLSVFSCGITLLSQSRDGAVVSTEEFTLLDRLAHVPVAYVWYILKFFWPVNLSVFYWRYANPESLPVVAGCICLLGGLSVAGFWLARRQPWLVVGWLWFGVTLIPVIGLVQVGNQAYANRYTYLPYIGLLILLAWGISKLLDSWPRLKLPVGLAGILVVFAAWRLTVEQVGYWQNNRLLFTQAIAQDATNVNAWFGLGLDLVDEGKLEEAEECFNRVIRINPKYYNALNSLGHVYFLQGRYGEARQAFETILRDKRGQKPEVYRNLGVLNSREAKLPEAIECYRHSLALNPNQPLIHFYLGKTWLAAQKQTEAIPELETVLRQQPDNLEAELFLAIALDGAGRSADAVPHYRRVVEEHESNAIVALNNLAWILATSPDAQLRNGVEAVQLARRACDLTHWQQTLYAGTLAAAYAEAGDFEQAIDTAQKACVLAEKHGETNLLQRNQQLLNLYRNHEPVRGF